jgi:hypothetical protein
MERIAGFEPRPQELSRLRVCCRSINGSPFGRKLVAALEAPVGIRLRDRLEDFVRADALEKALADDLADLCLVVRDKVFCDAPDDFVDLLLPLEVIVRHLHLTARQTD